VIYSSCGTKYKGIQTLELNLKEQKHKLYFLTQDEKTKWFSELEHGTRHYKIEHYYEESATDSQLGRGSRAEVTKAVNKITKQDVAVKKYKNEPDLCARRLIEIDIMKSSVHHYVTRIIDYFIDQEHTYFVMELEHGGTLKDYLTLNGNGLPE
jgi:hypothetical protein